MLGVSDMVNPTRAKDAAVAWALLRSWQRPAGTVGKPMASPAHASGRPAHFGHLTPTAPRNAREGAESPTDMAAR